MKIKSITKIVSKLNLHNGSIYIQENNLDIDYECYALLFEFKNKQVLISDLFQFEQWTVIANKFKTKDIQLILDRFNKVYANLKAFM